MGKFSDTIREFANATPQRAEAVRKRSIDLLAEKMATTRDDGGLVPRDTGNLARSLVGSASGPPKVSDTPGSGSNVGAVVAMLAPGAPMWVGYQAAYAHRQNYGYVGEDSTGRVYNQSGHYFLEGAIAEWPKFCAQAAKELKDRIEGGAA